MEVPSVRLLFSDGFIKQPKNSPSDKGHTRFCSQAIDRLVSHYYTWDGTDDLVSSYIKVIPVVTIQDGKRRVLETIVW